VAGEELCNDIPRFNQIPASLELGSRKMVKAPVKTRRIAAPAIIEVVEDDANDQYREFETQELDFWAGDFRTFKTVNDGVTLLGWVGRMGSGNSTWIS